MAELSGFWTTGGATGHQQVSYTQAQWSTAAEILAACNGYQGVAPGYKNGLAVTYISANHCHISSGGAVVDGKWYVNDADGLGITIDSASAGHYRIDRIVLLCDWAACTVTVAVKKNTVDDAAAPALTLTEDWTVSGTHYATLLYQARVTDAGVVTLTDEREYANRNIIYRRQGGSATVWTTAGALNYTPGLSIMQCGSIIGGAAPGSSGSITITFPVAFSNIPIGFASHLHNGDEYITMSVYDLSTTEMKIYWQSHSSDESDVPAYWLAIGPL